MSFLFQYSVNQTVRINVPRDLTVINRKWDNDPHWGRKRRRKSGWWCLGDRRETAEIQFEPQWGRKMYRGQESYFATRGQIWCLVDLKLGTKDKDDQGERKRKRKERAQFTWARCSLQRSFPNRSALGMYTHFNNTINTQSTKEMLVIQNKSRWIFSIKLAFNWYFF